MDFRCSLRICLIFKLWMLCFVVSLFSMPVTDMEGNVVPVAEIMEGNPEELQKDLTANQIHDGQTPEQKAEVERTLRILQEKAIREHGPVTAAQAHVVAAEHAPPAANLNTPQTYLFEMDIVLTPEDAHRKLSEQTGRVKRKFTAEKTEKWTLPIPYAFDTSNSSGYTDVEKKSIERAIMYWEVSTCIRFKDITDLNDYSAPHLVFTKDTGCWSYVGMQNTIIPQEVSIGVRCLELGTVAHEIGHAIGFWHEHSRPDRHEWITVNLSHADQKHWYNFEEESWGHVIAYGIPYDVGSLMHYGAKAFSNDGEITVQTNDPLQQRSIGQRIYLTFYDIKLANVAYCQDICAGVTLNCLHDGYPDPADCSGCRCPDGFGGRFCEQSAEPHRASCGGNYKIESGTLEITSPDYPSEYRRGEACNWYIVSPDNTTLHLQFETPFMNSSWCANKDETFACWDFVEVRYGTNLANTGATFCCNRPPSNSINNGIIVSKTNEMLVMYRSLYDGDYGFKATISIAGGGGCYKEKKPIEPALERRESYKCAREWIKRVVCESWWWLERSCNGYTKQSRYEVCHRNIKYCCKDYTLYGDKCYGPGALPPVTSDPTSSVLGGPQISKDTKSIVNDPTSGWSSWSAWSNCTQPCGGCGNRNRTRTCESSCGNEREQTERQTCNTTPCSINTVQLCPVKVKTRCDRAWSWVRCETYQYKLQPCNKPCCDGYVKVGEQCVANTV